MALPSGTILANEGVEADQEQGAGHEGQRIGRDQTGLEPAQTARSPIEDEAGQVDQSVDDVAIEQAGEPRAPNRRPPRAVDEPAVDRARVEPSDSAREPPRPAHHRPVVDRIDEPSARDECLDPAVPRGESGSPLGAGTVEAPGPKEADRGDGER